MHFGSRSLLASKVADRPFYSCELSVLVFKVVGLLSYPLSELEAEEVRLSLFWYRRLSFSCGNNA